MTLTMIQFTPKCWIVRYVSNNKWWEIAAWQTKKSGLSGWQWQNTAQGRGTGWGRRLITPRVGLAVWIGR